MKKIIFVFLAVAISALAYSHEFWMQPLKYYWNVGETVVINFKVGEDFIGEGWNLRKDRLIRLQHHAGGTSKDITSLAKEGQADQLSLVLEKEGTNVIVMESNPAYIELEAEKFNDYLKEDGLDDAFNFRVKNDEIAKAGTELYSRHTKLMLLAGKTNDENWKVAHNLPIEIHLEQNPALLRVGSKVSFKITFQGKPLFGAKVRVFNRHNNRTTMQPIYSQQDGRIETHISNPGAWMVTVVQMVKSDDPKADWRSYWGSVVFGVK